MQKVSLESLQILAVVFTKCCDWTASAFGPAAVAQNQLNRAAVAVYGLSFAEVLRGRMTTRDWAEAMRPGGVLGDSKLIAKALEWHDASQLLMRAGIELMQYGQENEWATAAHDRNMQLAEKVRRAIAEEVAVDNARRQVVIAIERGRIAARALQRFPDLTELAFQNGVEIF